MATSTAKNLETSIPKAGIKMAAKKLGSGDWQTHFGTFSLSGFGSNPDSVGQPTEKTIFVICFQFFLDLEPGFVSCVLGFVTWVFGIVILVSGFVNGMCGMVTH